MFFLTTSWLTPGNFIRPQKSSPSSFNWSYHKKHFEKSLLLFIRMPGRHQASSERARSLVMICLMSAKMSSIFDCSIVFLWGKRNGAVSVSHLLKSVELRKTVLNLRPKTDWNKHPSKNQIIHPIREMRDYFDSQLWLYLASTVEISTDERLRCALNALQLRGQKVQTSFVQVWCIYYIFLVGNAICFLRLQLPNCSYSTFATFAAIPDHNIP